jgi:hypothetical protein
MRSAMHIERDLGHAVKLLRGLKLVLKQTTERCSLLFEWGNNIGIKLRQFPLKPTPEQQKKICYLRIVAQRVDREWYDLRETKKFLEQQITAQRTKLDELAGELGESRKI